MGIMDKARDLIGGHKDQVQQGTGKAGDLVEEKTGGDDSSEVQEAEQKADPEVQDLGDQS